MKKFIFVLLLLLGFSSVNADLNNETKTYYKMDTNSGSTLFDSIASNDGTINGATWTTGKINFGLDFDGINDWVDLPAVLRPQGSESWTMNIWFNADVLSGNPNIWSFGTGTPYGRFYILSSNSLVLDFFDGVNNPNIIYPASLNTSEWYMATSVIDRTNSRLLLYFQGALVGNVSLSGLSTTYGTNFDLGQRAGSYFNGRLDEAGFWTKALNSAEVSELYNGGVGLQYPFNLPTLNIVNYTLNGVVFENNSIHSTAQNNFSIQITNSTTNLATVNATYLLYNSSGSLIDSQQFLTNGGTNFTDTQTTGTFQLNLSDGNYSININATNNQTTTVTGLYYFMIDTTLPLITIINNSERNTYDVDFTNIFNVTDPNLDTCFTITEGNTTNCFINYTFSFNGNRTIQVFANDTAGNEANLTIPIFINPPFYVRFFDTNNSVFLQNYSVQVDGGTTYNVGATDYFTLPIYDLGLGNRTLKFLKTGYPQSEFSLLLENDSRINQTYNITPLNFQFNFYDRTTGLLLNGTLVEFTVFNVFNDSTTTGTYATNVINISANNYTIQARSTDFYTETKDFTYSGEQSVTLDMYLLDETLNNSATLFVQVTDEFFNIIENADTRLLEYDPNILGFKEVSQCKTNSNGECQFLVEVGTKTYIITTTKVINGLTYTAQSSTSGEVFELPISGGEEVLGGEIVRALVLSLSDSLPVPDFFGLTISAPQTAEATIVTENSTSRTVYIPVSFTSSTGQSYEVCVKWQVQQGTNYQTVMNTCASGASGIVPTSNFTISKEFNWRAVITASNGINQVQFRSFIYPSSTSIYELLISDNLVSPLIVFLWGTLLAFSLYLRNIGVWAYGTFGLVTIQSVIFPNVFFVSAGVLIILINLGVLYVSKKQLDTT